ncbi:MAG: rod shape-determining protein MreD [Bacteroidales bacterium]|jgi:rod shape-determining protein MreD|nr:rod shape-determining protein MreD [Bacteroidales bacterium]MBR0500086.1 rod shape-determining protein MreD [Bacteroidales bacterium]
MNKLNEILFFVMVFILQLVISDYLHLGPWISLSLIPFFIVSISLQRSPQAVMLIAFGLGIGLDILSDGVVGLNAFAAVMAAAPRKFFYRLLVNSDRQDKTEILTPRDAGFAKYLRYLGIITAIYMAAYVLLDCVSFRPAGFMLLKFAASTVASTALCLLPAFSLQHRN